MPSITVYGVPAYLRPLVNGADAKRALVGVGAMQEQLVKMPSHSSSITMVDVGACAAALGISIIL